ncbi:MAG: GxxExxY protein [Alphaproteobacteria bacterium]|nr:MAG: GxxExxY protein [Alphaproteobacteria bacterium]
MNLLSGKVVDAIFKVHKELGPGFLEKVYEECLCIEFSDRKIPFQRQVQVNMTYNGRQVPADFRIDLVVDNKILIELKAVEQLHSVHEAQMYSYLKMSGLPLGFLVNFNVALIKDGLRRFVPKELRVSGSPR